MNLYLRSLSGTNLSWVTSQSSGVSCSWPVKISCCFSSTVATKKNKDYPPNNSIVPAFVTNRNPRNLEKLRIGEKPDGWSWEKPGKVFWNKVVFDVSGRHISGKIVHHLGLTPVSASTTEWCIKKFLYSTNDTPAAEAIGTVLATRCLRAGITEVSCFIPEEDRTKEKICAFLKALKEGGVVLSEPEQYIVPPFLSWRQLPEKGWEVHDDIDNELFKKLESIHKKS